MAGAAKETARLTGIVLSPRPHFELRVLYERVLRLAALMPEDYTYRKSIEKMVKERSSILDQNENIADVEQKIGQGSIQEVIIQTNLEVNLMQDIIRQKTWEKLVEKEPPHQWTWPPHK